MLSATVEDTALLSYPLLASVKIDGVRCIIRDGVAMSRSMKPIPNASVQAWACLLSTSDAADDMQCVVVGCRVVIKKKENRHNTNRRNNCLTTSNKTHPSEFT